MKKKVLLLGLSLSATLALSACGSQQNTSTADYIGIDAAKEAALKSAGINADQVSFSSAGLDSRDGIFYYEVEFSDGTTSYSYDIDAVTGVVIEESLQTLDAADGESRTAAGSATAEANAAAAGAAGTAETGTADTGTAGTAESGAAAAENSAQAGGAAPGAENGKAADTAGTTGAAIGQEEAQSIALSHAGVSEDDLTYIKVKPDRNDGLSVFEVEFFSSAGIEYDYEIKAEDGTILSYDFDAKSSLSPSQNSAEGLLSEDQARQIALDRVPGASGDNLFVRLDEDDRRMVYEGKLVHDSMEYEFKIDAYSGALIEWEAEQLR